MAKNSMKDVERNVDVAIDNDMVNAQNGPKSGRMFGPGDGVPDPQRSHYLRAQKAAEDEGTDGAIMDAQRAQAQMGVPIQGTMGGFDDGEAALINGAWKQYNQNPTDANYNKLRIELDKYHIPQRNEPPEDEESMYSDK